jgi:hypothetical protein
MTAFVPDSWTDVTPENLPELSERLKALVGQDVLVTVDTTGTEEGALLKFPMEMVKQVPHPDQEHCLVLLGEVRVAGLQPQIGLTFEIGNRVTFYADGSIERESAQNVVTIEPQS